MRLQSRAERLLLGQRARCKRICTLGCVEPEKVRALFVYRNCPALNFITDCFYVYIFLLFFIFAARLLRWECNERIGTQPNQQQQQQLWSQRSDSGTACDLLHQALREAWQIQHHTAGQRGGGRRRMRKRRWDGPKGAQPIPPSAAPSVCHIPLLCISSGEQKQQAMQKQMLR